MSVTRRDLLKAGLAAGTLVAVPRPLLARIGAHWEPVPPIQDPRVKNLALRAVEAAAAAGAAYADVRLTHTRVRSFPAPDIRRILDEEQIVVGVRALVNGYWGFASGPEWSPEEMVRLGEEAVHQAKVNALGRSRLVELAPVPPVRDGHWVMPVATDPFEVSPFEIVDYLQSLRNFVSHFPEFRASDNRCAFQVQEKAFASSEGTYCTQRLYRAEGVFQVLHYKGERVVAAAELDRLTPAGMGWELYTGQPLREAIEQLIDELREHATLPQKPVEVGRYDVACDALTVARLLERTLGRATELDRALGYEANAGGTSYLTDPVAMLGSHQAGASAMTVTADRSVSGGAATVAWDDEGVRPDEFVLVRDGVLADFQTTRESAGWLTDAYAKTGQPFRSHGCAAAPSALEAPLTHTPNLTLAPSGTARDFDAVLAELGDGLAIRGLGVDMDFQGLNGLGLSDRIYEVKRGKRVARIVGAGVLFRGPDLWKGLLALGGPQSVRRYGLGAVKGEPAQRTYHSVTVPPAAFKQLTVIDPMRKA